MRTVKLTLESSAWIRIKNKGLIEEFPFSKRHDRSGSLGETKWQKEIIEEIIVFLK